MLNNVYALNIASRRLQRKIKEKDLEEKNLHFIERIVQIKTKSHTPHMHETLPTSRSRERKKRNHSVFLPPIS